MLNPLKATIMKNVLTLILSVAFVGTAMTSCSNERVMPSDTGAQAFMQNTTFLVDGFEVYNHDRKTTNELTLTCDSIYITFAENNMYITKVLFNANDPEQTYYDYSTMEVHYGNGAFMGVWSNPTTFMDAVGFSRNGKTAGFELSGADCTSGEFMSQFIRMTAMDKHPKAALTISGLPG